MIPPKLEQWLGIAVVRDDLFPGGTKARWMPAIFEGTDEVVYASPPEGGAQIALAATAARLGKKATIFTAKRGRPHARTWQAKELGARVLQVAPGYMTLIQKRARIYAERQGARLAPFGFDLEEIIEAIGAAAKLIDFDPEEVWCAAGSGVLMRGLARAWPRARRHAVQIGHRLTPENVDHARLWIHPLPFQAACGTVPPFPADPHYDAKAWEICIRQRGAGRVLFWNVIAPPPKGFA